MAVVGMRGTGDCATDERPKDFREYILWSQPNGAAPLTAFMSKMRKQGLTDPEFNWWEESLEPVRLTVDATGASITSTTIGVTVGGQLLVAGDVVLVEKTETSSYNNEIMVVSSVTSDTSVVFKRGQAGSTAAAIPAASNLLLIGSAFEEGSDAADASTRNPTKRTNYAQIVKTGYRITNTAKLTSTRTGDTVKNDKKRKMFDHSVKLEHMLMFGRPYEDNTGTEIKRYSGGLRHFITDNVSIWTTTPTEDTFLDFVSPMFNVTGPGSGAGNQRLVFAGNGFLNSLNKMAKNSASTRINFDQIVKIYGMSLQRWILPQGELFVRSHPLLSQNSRYTYSAFFIDPSALIWRYLRDTKPEDNIQAPGKDEMRGQWLTEAGLEIEFQQTMGYTGNFIV